MLAVIVAASLLCAAAPADAARTPVKVTLRAEPAAAAERVHLRVVSAHRSRAAVKAIVVVRGTSTVVARGRVKRRIRRGRNRVRVPLVSAADRCGDLELRITARLARPSRRGTMKRQLDAPPCAEAGSDALTPQPSRATGDRGSGRPPGRDGGGGGETVVPPPPPPPDDGGTVSPPGDTTDSRLRWAPPALSNPVTLHLGTGYTSNTLDPTRDYIIVMPSSLKTGATVLQGGRNIVMIGGRATIPPGTTSDMQRRAVYIKNAVGTVHLEGLELFGTPGVPMDAIAINAPDATVQIQNVRATGIEGSFAGFHSDVVQPWGGVRELRIDRLTGTSNYQGLFLKPDLGPIGPVTLENVDLTHTTTPTDGGGHLLWVTDGCTGISASLSNVYVASQQQRELGRLAWPATNSGLSCAAQVSGDTLAWPALPVSGLVRLGPPPGGEFVPAGVAGTAYQSPGYR